MREPRRVRLALAAVAGCTAAIAIYAVMRVVQALVSPDPDPALVLWSEHSGYFWRAWTSAYAAGTAAFIAYVAAGRNAERTARALEASVVAAALLLAAQALLVP